MKLKGYTYSHLVLNRREGERNSRMNDGRRWVKVVVVDGEVMVDRGLGCIRWWISLYKSGNRWVLAALHCWEYGRGWHGWVVHGTGVRG